MSLPVIFNELTFSQKNTEVNTMNNKEKLIQILNKKFLESTNNSIYLYENNINELNIPEQEAVSILLTMQVDKFIKIIKRPSDNDFSWCWQIEILEPCVNYFDNKKANSSKNRNKLIAFLITTIIAIIGVIVTILK